MSSFIVYYENQLEQLLKLLIYVEDIVLILVEVGVCFECWEVVVFIVVGVSQDEVIVVYVYEIEWFKCECGYIIVDVVSLNSDYLQKVELCVKFFDEYCYGEDEVCFFVVGCGLFVLYIEEYVYVVFCECNDLILVLVGICYWFDMGEYLYFVVVCLFNNLEGWVVQFIGDDIVSCFFLLED